MRIRSTVASLAAAGLLLAACGETDHTELTQPQSTAVDASQIRLEQVQDAVERWRDAATIEDAHAAAEEARNLITGPDTLDAGDLDEDGDSHGLGYDGLLPGEAGSAGLAAFIEGCAAVDRDVLGGSWDDPASRWDVLAAAIDSWSDTNNPFPSLPSHPQRIVGWATLTLRSTDLAEAEEFAGHAQLHVDVTREALETCET